MEIPEDHSPRSAGSGAHSPPLLEPVNEISRGWAPRQEEHFDHFVLKLCTCRQPPKKHGFFPSAGLVCLELHKESVRLTGFEGQLSPWLGPLPRPQVSAFHNRALPSAGSLSSQQGGDRLLDLDTRSSFKPSSNPPQCARDETDRNASVLEPSAALQKPRGWKHNFVPPDHGCCARAGPSP